MRRRSTEIISNRSRDWHPQHRFPYVSLLWMGAAAMAFCFLRLADVIAALVVIRIMLQFLLQAAGVMVLRVRRPDMPRPFRMWMYPLPALLAMAGFLYVLFGRSNFGKEIRYALLILISGTVIFSFVHGERVSGPLGRRRAAHNK